MEFTVGDYAEAARALNDALAHDPNNAGLQFDLGLVHAANHEWECARDSFCRAFEANRCFAHAALNAAIICSHLGNRKQSRSLFKAAIGLKWHLCILWLRTAFARSAETLKLLQSSAGWNIPTRDLPEIHDLISLGFLKRGEIKRAEMACRRAITLAPTGVRYGALGNIFQRMGRLEDARRAMEEALRLEPDLELARHHLAMIAFHQYRYAEARLLYETIIRDNPNDVFTMSRLLVIDTLEGKLDSAEATFRNIVRLGFRDEFMSQNWEALTTIAYRGIMWPLPRAANNALVREIDRQLTATAKARGGPYSERARSPEKRIRIGYLSAHFGNHPIGHVTADLFRHHDRGRFEVHLFWAGAGKRSVYTELIAAGAEFFHHLPGKISETAKAIRDQDLDVLIYLDGYMEHRLMQVVAMRPAPVQVYWLGHAGGCELSSIDFLIADETVLTPAEEQNYRAKVLRLPDTYHCASSHAIGPVPSRAEAGLPNTGFVFTAFNNPEKIERTIFDSWVRILAAVPDSVIWLSLGPSLSFADSLKNEAVRAGISPERWIFADRVPDKADHLGRLKLCGLHLDTITLNASTTALDSLWAGVPVLTVYGDRFASRIASSMLKAVGLEEMVCHSLAQYEERAIFLATHPGELSSIRAKLAQNLTSYPLFKIDRFCRNLERAITQAAERRVAGSGIASLTSP